MNSNDIAIRNIEARYEKTFVSRIASLFAMLAMAASIFAAGPIGENSSTIQHSKVVSLSSQHANKDQPAKRVGELNDIQRLSVLESRSAGKSDLRTLTNQPFTLTNDNLLAPTNSSLSEALLIQSSLVSVARSENFEARAPPRLNI